MNDVIAFSAANPLGALAESDVRFVVERLVRGPEGVLDEANDHGTERLVGALIERGNDEAHAAEVVFFGANCAGDALSPLFERAVDHALAVAKTESPRTAIQVWLSPPLAHLATALTARGFAHAFSSYTMKTTDARFATMAPTLGFSFIDWTPTFDVASVHAVVQRAFVDVPGNLGLDVEALRERLAAASAPTRLLIDADGVLVGVSRLARGAGERPVGVIQVLARDPARRGERLGDVLLSDAMSTLYALGVDHFELEVVTQNASALMLYRRHGFEVVSTETTWRRALV
ncbi:MAG: GNAT family N-acetyltransferase [Polyangiaceae bacterium]